jgi:hypothetical protein
MSQGVLLREPVRMTYTAAQETCPRDDTKLWVVQHRARTVHRLDETIEATFRDKACPRDGCSAPDLRFRPAEESMLALPGSSFGLDVVTAIGAMRFRDDASFPRIHARLAGRGVPISPMSVQNQFRNYLALCSCQAGVTDAKLVKILKKQGVIVPVIDGVQFGEGDPVLYLIIDAISKRPLFGKELFCRSACDLVPFIRQIKEIDVPILAVVSDKEKGLVPAIAEALPGTPHQLCQLHYVGNAAKPMDEDLQALGAEIRQTEHDLRACERRLLKHKRRAEDMKEPVPADIGVSLELCQAARAEARRHARAPFDPPALKRHEGLERVARATTEARRGKGGRGRTSKSLKAS